MSKHAKHHALAVQNASAILANQAADGPNPLDDGQCQQIAAMDPRVSPYARIALHDGREALVHVPTLGSGLRKLGWGSVAQSDHTIGAPITEQVFQGLCEAESKYGNIISGPQGPLAIDSLKQLQNVYSSGLAQAPQTRAVGSVGTLSMTYADLADGITDPKAATAVNALDPIKAYGIQLSWSSPEIQAFKGISPQVSFNITAAQRDSVRYAMFESDAAAPADPALYSTPDYNETFTVQQRDGKFEGTFIFAKGGRTGVLTQRALVPAIVGPDVVPPGGGSLPRPPVTVNWSSLAIPATDVITAQLLVAGTPGWDSVFAKYIPRSR